MENQNGSKPVYDGEPPRLTEEDWERLFVMAEEEYRPSQKPFINMLMIVNGSDPMRHVPMLAKALSHVIVMLRGSWYSVVKDRRPGTTGQEYHINTLSMFLRQLEADYGEADRTNENT